MAPERLAELDAAYAKQAGTPFGENWIHLNTAAKHHIFAAYPDLRALIDAQAATIARHDEALRQVQALITEVMDLERIGAAQAIEEMAQIVNAALTGAA